MKKSEEVLLNIAEIINENKDKEKDLDVKISLSSSEMEVKKKYYLLVNKMFIQRYGINFALLLSELDRATYTMEAKTDDEGYLELSYLFFQKDIRLSKDQVKPLIDKMVKWNFVDIKYTHEGRRKLYRVNRDIVTADLINIKKEYEAKKRRGK